MEYVGHQSLGHLSVELTGYLYRVLVEIPRRERLPPRKQEVSEWLVVKENSCHNDSTHAPQNTCTKTDSLARSDVK